MSKLMKMEEEHRPDGLYYELCELITSPHFQRQGLGSQLVRYGLDKADRDGTMCFLSGSPIGAPVYKKLGFEEVGRLEIELEDFGGEGSHVHGEFDLWVKRLTFEMCG
jgi:ribosomal protein S18 acetylase RimI-like enzyme